MLKDKDLDKMDDNELVKIQKKIDQILLAKASKRTKAKEEEESEKEDNEGEAKDDGPDYDRDTDSESESVPPLNLREKPKSPEHPPGDRRKRRRDTDDEKEEREEYEDDDDDRYFDDEDPQRRARSEPAYHQGYGGYDHGWNWNHPYWPSNTSWHEGWSKGKGKSKSKKGTKGKGKKGKQKSKSISPETPRWVERVSTPDEIKKLLLRPLPEL